MPSDRPRSSFRLVIVAEPGAEAQTLEVACTTAVAYETAAMLAEDAALVELWEADVLLWAKSAEADARPSNVVPLFGGPRLVIAN